MDNCPACGSHRVFRSKSRTAFERFRRQFTLKRPYRCHACNWRGWAPDGTLAVSPSDVLDAPAPAGPGFHRRGTRRKGENARGVIGGRGLR